MEPGRAERKLKFAGVPLANVSPLLRNAAENDRAKSLRPRKILSVSYDETLATTREMLFSRAGFQVCSALNVAQVIEHSATEVFDLVVVGHSIPAKDRKLILKQLRKRCTAPVLALRHNGQPELEGADHALDSSDDPIVLLQTVAGILRA
ncbi:MAG TPA: hypothetical protein VFA71_15370 [Terriglobales bacterium]|nr:hypothetical protein [Terriglobales bacterium]